MLSAAAQQLFPPSALCNCIASDSSTGDKQEQQPIVLAASLLCNGWHPYFSFLERREGKTQIIPISGQLSLYNTRWEQAAQPVSHSKAAAPGAPLPPLLSLSQPTKEPVRKNMTNPYWWVFCLDAVIPCHEQLCSLSTQRNPKVWNDCGYCRARRHGGAWKEEGWGVRMHSTSKILALKQHSAASVVKWFIFPNTWGICPVPGAKQQAGAQLQFTADNTSSVMLFFSSCQCIPWFTFSCVLVATFKKYNNNYRVSHAYFTWYGRAYRDTSADMFN